MLEHRGILHLFTEHDGARLFSTTIGDGPDLLLLHPTPANHAFWLPLAEHLRQNFRLTWIDLRGHGQSTLGVGPVTMDKIAGDIHAVLQTRGIQRAAFAGCSIGGYALYEYWRRFPQEVTALAILCGKPQPDTAANREKRHEWMRAAQQPDGLAKFFDQMADTLVGATARWRHPEIRTRARSLMDAVSLDAMLAVQQGLMTRPDSLPTLDTIRVPVCAIAGGEDQSSTPVEMRVIAERVPDAEFHLLPDAGHYAPLEQPGRVAAILSEFLGRALRKTGTIH